MNCDDTRNWEGNENKQDSSSFSAINSIRNSNTKLVHGIDIVKELENIVNELPDSESLEPPRQISPQRSRLMTPNRARRLKIEEAKEEDDPNDEKVHRDIVNDLELL